MASSELSPAFCFLKDQKPISQEAFQRARKVCLRIGSLIEGRADFLRRARRDLDIHLPHGNWELGGGKDVSYQTVLKGEYEVINNLRLFSQIYTGHQLTTLKALAGLPIPREIPPNLDEQLVQCAASPGHDVALYLDRIGWLPEALHISPPNVFGEVGWLVAGKIVNHDTNAYLERVALLAESGVLWHLRNRTPALTEARRTPWKRPRILEIGSGYGGLAHHLLGLIPEARYCVVDIPESLLFASIYLSTLWQDIDNVLITPDNLDDLDRDSAGVTFLPNYLFDDCLNTGIKWDLVINTLSMSEMTEKQVDYYAQGIRRLLGGKGVFFEQNQDNRHVGMLDAKSLLAGHFRHCLPLGRSNLFVTQGAPHLWSDVPVPPYKWVASADALRPGRAAPAAPASTGDQPVLMEEGYFGINVIYYRGTWYGLPQDSGPFDAERAYRKDYPSIFTAHSKEKLKKAIDARIL